ncbi:MAG: hypothetical protein PHD19_11515 [Dechloromonas sp.]|nr:hypothetical protein [Dechloromonas sp.]
MPGTMSRADLVADLKAALMDSARTFSAPADADFVRMLDIAAADMHRVRPRSLVGAINLQADKADYAAPADMIELRSMLWGVGQRAQPWERRYAGRLPTARQIGTLILLSPAPTERQILLLGAEFKFLYVARDAISDSAGQTTIPADDRHLLLLRAQAEAMLMLAQRDSVRPVQSAAGHGSQAKTGLPVALWKELMAAWLEAA